MIKRMNKVTSLLVAAAAVATVLPATGVNAAERLEVKEGTFADAIAVRGGYIFDGYKNGEKDNDGIYLSINGEDKLLDIYTINGAVVSGDYVIVDDLKIDTRTGEITEVTESESSVSFEKEELTLELKKALSKVQRYKDLGISFTSGFEISEISATEDWYSYGTTTSAIIYANDEGDYIETAVTANIPVFTGKTVKTIAEFGKTDSSTVAAELLRQPVVIGEDDDFIYRVVEVKLTGATQSTAKYLQKISKDQGAKKDGAYLPKSVESFLIDDAAISLITADEDKEVIFDRNEITVVETNSSAKEITITKVDLTRSGKDVSYFGTEESPVRISKVTVATYENDSNVQKYAAKTIDEDGNIWVLYNGKILKSIDADEFEEVYTCNKNFDQINVLDYDNLVVWDESTGLYSVVQEEVEDEDQDDEDQDDEDQDDSEDEDDKEEESYKAGWNQVDGEWVYADANGDLVTGWVQVNGTWYFMDKTTGLMKTGWLYEGGQWYYLNPVSNGTRGAMKTGWLFVDGQWYYLKSNGQMISNKWFQDTDGRWYFLKSSGAMATNTTIGGYTVGANGAWIR